MCFHLHEFYPEAAEFSLAQAAQWPQLFATGVEPRVFLSSMEGGYSDELHSITNARAKRYIYRRSASRSNYRIMAYARPGDTLDSTRPVYTNVYAIGRY